MHLSPWMVRWGNFVTGHKMTVGAMVAWVDAGEVLLVRSKHGQQLWGFPGGVINKREDPLEGGQRELREETGLHCELSDLTIVGAHVQEHGRHLDTIFRVRRTRPDSGPLVSSDTFEIAEVGWFPVGSLPELRYETQRACTRHPVLLTEENA